MEPRDIVEKFLDPNQTDQFFMALKTNNYNIFDVTKLIAEVNSIKQGLMQEITEKYILIPKNEWEHIKNDLTNMKDLVHNATPKEEQTSVGPPEDRLQEAKIEAPTKDVEND